MSAAVKKRGLLMPIVRRDRPVPKELMLSAAKIGDQPEPSKWPQYLLGLEPGESFDVEFRVLNRVKKDAKKVGVRIAVKPLLTRFAGRQMVAIWRVA